MKLIIGLVGEKGSGKETFAKIFQSLMPDKKIAHIRFSDHLKDTLTLWDIPITRANLQKIAIVMKDNFSPDAVSHAVYQRINAQDADYILLDGVRWESDVELTQEFKNNLLVYITADLKVRFERLKTRNEKVGEETTPYEQFTKEEQAENELLIPEIGASSDYKIENDGSLEEYKQKVEEFISKKL